MSAEMMCPLPQGAAQHGLHPTPFASLRGQAADHAEVERYG
jgi:hypothetical protein